MIEAIKLTKDVTLVTESDWGGKWRKLQCRLRPPKKEYYDKEEEAVRFEGTTLYVNNATLAKYGINLEVSYNKLRDYSMKKISIFGDEASKIKDICKEYRVTEAEVIIGLLEAIEDNNIDLGDWL